MARGSFAWSLGAALALLLGTSVEEARPATPTAFLPSVFHGAKLGITVQDWKSLLPPPGVGLTALPACSNETRIAKVPGYALSATEVKSGVAACTYVNRFGHEMLAQSMLVGGFQTSRLTYLFTHDRLSELRFDVSTDAYNKLFAMLKGSYGRPTRTVRSMLRTPAGPIDQIRQSWSTPGGDVTLVDPSGQINQMSIRLVAAGRPPHSKLN